MKTKLIGMEINNPIIIAPGPWTRGRDRLERALKLGAGALFTETIVSESYPDLKPRYDYSSVNGGVENIRLYSGADLETWIDDLNYINDKDRFGSATRVIASIMGSSPSEAVYIARKIVKTGVDGIELGVACPMGEGPEIVAGDPAKVYEYTKAVVDAVDIPVSVKISAATGNLPAVVKSCIKAGASGISGIDTIRCILSIDTDTGRPGLPTYGGYSGAPIRPIGLSAVAGIAQTTSLPIAGMGGIQNVEHAIEYIMAGASAAGIGSEILIKGYDVVSKCVAGIDDWFEKHNITDIEQIRGATLRYLKSFEEIKDENKHAEVKASCIESECAECMLCCLEDAISMDGRISVDQDKCTGCGLCVRMCPEHKLELVW